ncbi:hypothetical protein BD626DRAFT_500684, partial [Schizophyllum amplum]
GRRVRSRDRVTCHQSAKSATVEPVVVLFSTTERHYPCSVPPSSAAPRMSLVYNMMDIDSQASPRPHIRAMRSFGTVAKRPRSPDSEDLPLERPVKRIATDMEARPVISLSVSGSGSNQGSRQSSEDPMLSSGPSESGGDDAMDVAMDAMPSSPSAQIGQNHAFASSAPSLVMPAAAADCPHSSPFTGDVTGTPLRHGPHIQITPATPMSSFPSSGTMSQPATPLERSDSMAMAISSPSRTPVSPPFTRRFTMGPRLDCEKCRLGVEGHYAHYT